MGGGGKGSSQTTTNTYDAVSSRKMAAVAERQQDMAEDQWEMYKQYFQDYEIQAAEANKELLPYITEASKLTMQEQVRDLELNQPIKDLMRENQAAELSRGKEISSKFYDEALRGVNKADWQNEAQADVAQALGASEAQARRDAARMGINVDGSKMASMLKTSGLERAKAIGGARYAAGKAAETESFSRLGLAMNANRSAQGLPGIQSTQGNGTQQLATADPANRAMAGMQGAAGSYGTLASRVMSSTQSTSGGGGIGSLLGKVAGTGLGALAGGAGSAYGASLFGG